MYDLELKSESEEDDLFWIEQDSKVVSHNCFPKDINGLVNWCEQNNVSCDMFKSAIKVNDRVRKNKDWLEIKGATSENNYT